jgi:hypothetical protein
MTSRRSQATVIQAEVEVDSNPPRSVRRKRTEKITVGVRHLCSNLGADGAIRLAAFRVSSPLPTEITFSSTFPGIRRHISRVDRFSIELKGSLGKPLATTIGSCPTCTDSNWVVRLRGFTNCKNDQAYRVAVEYSCAFIWDSDSAFWPRMPSFRLADSQRESIPLSAQIPNTIGHGLCMNFLWKGRRETRPKANFAQCKETELHVLRTENGGRRMGQSSAQRKHSDRRRCHTS